MLKAARLYTDELMKKDVEGWYDIKNMYWNGGCYSDSIKLEKSNWSEHQFVSVNEKNELLGYISYSVDHAALKAYNFGIISFQKGNPDYAKDLYQIVLDIFYKYNLNKIEFCAYTDNPALRGYKNFIEKVGGRIVGVRHQTTILLDHKLHDNMEFEILKENFRPLNNWRFNKENIPAKKINKKIFIINGSAGVGKDTFVSYINGIIPVKNFSSVEKVKELATNTGWNGEKTEKARKFLSDLKALTTDFNDMSFEDMKRAVKDFKNDTHNEAMFLHIREINEIKRAKEEFNATTILVTRLTIEQVISNESDANVMDYDYDVTIPNDKGLEELKELAKQFAILII